MALYPTVLRIETLKTYRNISGSAGHNLRLSGDLDHVDVSRTHLNKILVGDTDVVGAVKAVEKRYAKARKDSPLAFEVVCSAHKDFFADKSPDFINNWADATIKFHKKRFGEVAVVHAVLHMDEEAPHLHLTIVPLAKTIHRNRYGETHSIKINYSQCIGIPRGFYAPGTSADQKRTGILQTEYAEAMAPFGLIRGAGRGAGAGGPKKNVSPKQYRDSLAADLNRLYERHEEMAVPFEAEKRLIVEESIVREIVDKHVALRIQDLKEENSALKNCNAALEQLTTNVSNALGCPSPAQLQQYATDLRNEIDRLPQGIKRLQVIASRGADARQKEEAQKLADQEATRKLLEDQAARPRRTKGQRATPEERRAAREARRASTANPIVLQPIHAQTETEPFQDEIRLMKERKINDLAMLAIHAYVAKIKKEIKNVQTDSDEINQRGQMVNSIPRDQFLLTM